mmetsp:Transcript_92213/g.298555  ORF Transcript_92213/g.298555 Transcript_92213/m.298555 type:complete len:283 (+) Transcript_92213:78-926(+)
MGSGQSQQRSARAHTQALEVALQHERENVALLEASVRHEREGVAKMQRRVQAGLVGSIGVVALVSAAVPLLVRRKVTVAVAAAERLLAAEHQAIMEDARRRAAIDLQNAHKFATDGLARDLLPVADNLEYALKHAQHGLQQWNATVAPTPDKATTELEAIIQGVSLTEQSLLDAFSKHGIQKQEPLAQQFDPNVHEAVMQAADTGAEPGTVARVMRSGFTIHERVLRAAQVSVVAHAPEKAPAVAAVGENGGCQDEAVAGAPRQDPSICDAHRQDPSKGQGH